MSITLWGINRWLRYTGCRLYVKFDYERIKQERVDLRPTEIGVMWVGFPGSQRWKEMQP